MTADTKVKKCNISRVKFAKSGVYPAAERQLRYHAPLHRLTRITNVTLLENFFMNQAAKTPTGHGYTASQTIASFDNELW
ncbi:MAG: hypothetical protein VYB01_02375, partial [Pseudomonadota bacterium]|nr:hypothetical protein [Pseudomonadota bacterium]